MSGELENWWRTLPPVTRFLFTGMFVLTLAANFGLVNPMYLILDFNHLYRRFEVSLSRLTGQLD